MSASSSRIPRPAKTSGTVQSSRLPIPARLQFAKPTSPSVSSTRSALTMSIYVRAQSSNDSSNRGEPNRNIPRPTRTGVPRSIPRTGIEARSGFLSPKAVWSTSAQPQRPKYQLTDPGVLSPIRSTIPRARRNPQPVLEAIPSRIPRTPTIPLNVKRAKLEPGRPASAAKSSDKPVRPSKTAASSTSIETTETELVYAQQPTIGSPPLPSMQSVDLDKTPTVSSVHSTASIALTSTSSSYSSASSMARARAAREQPWYEYPYSTSDDINLADNLDEISQEDCAPYLVPRGEEMTLAWIPDPEAEDVDPAEEVWKRLEQKMGRRIRPPTIKDRGRWVAKRVEGVCPTDTARGISEDMDRQPSEFSISEYYIPEDDLDSERGVDLAGTALFDMSAPLIPSVSTSAATPANTPCIRRETLQRVGRIQRRPHSHTSSTMTTSVSSTESPPSSEAESTVCPDATEMSIQDPAEEVEDKGRMYRLDSHIISVLNAFQADFDSPDLDIALGLDVMDPYSIEDAEVEIFVAEGNSGLGLGIPLSLDSVYGLPKMSFRMDPKIVSPLGRWRKLKEKGHVTARGGDEAETDERGIKRYETDGMESGDEGILRIKDLDTGLIRAVSMGDLDGESGAL